MVIDCREQYNTFNGRVDPVGTDFFEKFVILDDLIRPGVVRVKSFRERRIVLPRGADNFCSNLKLPRLIYTLYI